MGEFRKIHNDFNYFYQKKLMPGDKVICVIPTPSGKAKSVKSITWSTNTTVTTQATISADPQGIGTVWENVRNGNQLAPTVTAIRFEVAKNDYGYVCIRVVME